MIKGVIISMITKPLLIATEMNVIKDIGTFISNNGVMIVISAVVIYFLIRVLNSLLDQNARVVNEISSRVDKIEKSLSDILVKYNETETRRNLSVNKQFSEVQNMEKDILNKLKMINREITSIDTALKDLGEQIDKQHVYIDFYQEQLKKEKGS